MKYSKWGMDILKHKRYHRNSGSLGLIVTGRYKGFTLSSLWKTMIFQLSYLQRSSCILKFACSSHFCIKWSHKSGEPSVKQAATVPSFSSR